VKSWTKKSGQWLVGVIDHVDERRSSELLRKVQRFTTLAAAVRAHKGLVHEVTSIGFVTSAVAAADVAVRVRMFRRGLAIPLKRVPVPDGLQPFDSPRNGDPTYCDGQHDTDWEAGAQAAGKARLAISHITQQAHEQHRDRKHQKGPAAALGFDLRNNVVLVGIGSH
jgi:hypothetical protein